MLNIKDAGQVLLEDGVYGRKMVDTWIKFFDKLLRFSETAPVVTIDDDKDWVIGLGAYGSAHLMVGGSVGKMIYCDDKGNVAIVNTCVINATTDVGATVGGSVEWTSTANDVSDMSGNWQHPKTCCILKKFSSKTLKASVWLLLRIENFNKFLNCSLCNVSNHGNQLSKL